MHVSEHEKMMRLLRNVILLVSVFQQQSTFCIAVYNDDEKLCTLQIENESRNLRKEPRQLSNLYNNKEYQEQEIQPGEGDSHRRHHRHRRLVSFSAPLSECKNSNTIKVDIPDDRVIKSFQKESRIDGDENYGSPFMRKYSYWSGISGDGSIFNFVQNDEGNIAGSLVDLESEKVLQFHNQNGSYVMTTTASSDFAPEDEPIHDHLTTSHNGRRLWIGRNDNNISNTISTRSSSYIIHSAVLNNTSSSNEDLSDDGVMSVKNSTNNSFLNKPRRKLYDDSGENLDVMVVWTKAAECQAYGQTVDCTVTSASEANMQALINLAVHETNSAYQASGVHTELLLVHSYRHPDYNEMTDKTFAVSLNDIKIGGISGVHSNREIYGADIVSLIVYDGPSCGIGYIGPRIDRMYSVVAWNCATGYYTFGHEIGHNLGCYHDRGTEGACDNLGGIFGNSNYGYRDPQANFRTVLAYDCIANECDNNVGGGCTRIPRYSNPHFNYNGLALGDTNNDNVRQMNDVRKIVAKYFTHISSTSAPTATTPAPFIPKPTTSPSSKITYNPVRDESTLDPVTSTCGDNICVPAQGEGCGSCHSDCFFPIHCDVITINWFGGFTAPETYGMVFDVIVGSRSLYFYEIGVALTKVTDAKVYMKEGSYSSDSDLGNWMLVFDGSIGESGTVVFARATINFASRFYAVAGSTVACYISFGSAQAFIFAGTGNVSNSYATIKTGNILREQTYDVLPPVLYSGYDFGETIKYDFAETFSTYAPVASTLAPTLSCEDRQDSWEIGQKIRLWCRWVKKAGEANIASRCELKNLYDDCPVTCGSCPVAATLAPVVSTPAPILSTAAPMVQTPAPVTSTASPTLSTAAPVVQTPAPMVQTPAPVTKTSAPVVQTPAPMVQTPAPVTKTSAPVIKTSAPMVHTPAPVPSTAAPTISPVTFTQAPVASTPAPVASTGAPLSSTPTVNKFTVVPTISLTVPSASTPAPTISAAAQLSSTPALSVLLFPLFLVSF